MKASMSNPFSTRFTRPGRIVPLDSEGAPIDTAALLQRFETAGWVAAIIGPHGSGKTTLLGHLADAMEARGCRVSRLRLRSRREALGVLAAIGRAGPAATLCIDSWECLGASTQGLLRLVARVFRCGLLVTAHGPSGLPVLVHCHTSAGLLERICQELSGHDGWYGTLIKPCDVDVAFARQRGNIREAMYELYDTFELRSRSVLPQRS